MTRVVFPSITATQLLVVPKSMPMIFPMLSNLLQKGGAAWITPADAYYLGAVATVTRAGRSTRSAMV